MVIKYPIAYFLFTEVKNCYPSRVCGSPASDDTTDDSLQELERINKEIEAVRHEVEQEQRRLSHYQTKQSDSRNPVSKSETTVKRLDRRSLSSHSDFKKTYSRTRKYVVDNSKPRTDLEYDPLSNFSADLRSYSSSGKEQGVKNAPVINGERDTLPCDQKKPAPQTPSPGLLEDPIEDSVLIIDIPPSPDQTSGQSQKLDCVAGSAQATVEHLKERVPIALGSPLLRLADAEAHQVTSPHATRVESLKVDNCNMENNQYPSTLYENKGWEHIPVDGSVIDLTGCLEDLENECQRISCQAAETEVDNSPEPVSPPASSDQQYQSYVNLGIEEEGNAPQVELQEVSGTSVTVPGQMQGGSLNNQASAVMYQEQAEPASGSNQCQNQNSSTSVNSHLMNRGDSTSKTTEELLVKEGPEAVIIISSSEDEQEINYSDMELSESDPMEECYRIFMEANNEDKGNKEQPDVSVSMMLILQIQD